MLITLDGYSGAGKTTQSMALCEQLQIPRISFAEVRHTYSAFLDHCFPDAKRTRSEIFAQLIFIHKHPDHGVIDHFWDIFNRYTHPSNSIAEARLAVDVFRSGLTLNGRSEPVLSFFLYAPSYICQHRRLTRDTQGTVGLIGNTVATNRDRLNYEFWKSIESMVPYFHIIDAMQPIPAVTEDIMQYVEGLQ